MLAPGSRAFLPAAWIATALGCGSAAPPQVPSEFLTIATLYQGFVAEHRAPPKDEAEFRRYISDKGGKLLETQNIASIDALFRSTRDGQPLKVVYGPEQSQYGHLGVFEQSGVEGKRLVAGAMGSIGQADEAEFREMAKPGA